MQFIDSEGRDWAVREVNDPNLEMIPPHLLTQPAFARGWLLFECGGEKRRLAPFPDDWTNLSVEQLEEWSRRASRVDPVPASSCFSPVARAVEMSRV
jgi:hypothetical protein